MRPKAVEIEWYNWLTVVGTWSQKTPPGHVFNGFNKGMIIRLLRALYLAGYGCDQAREFVSDLSKSDEPVVHNIEDYCRIELHRIEHFCSENKLDS